MRRSHGGIGGLIVQQGEYSGNNAILIGADQPRGARRHPFGSFGGIAHDQHGLAEQLPAPLPASPHALTSR